MEAKSKINNGKTPYEYSSGPALFKYLCIAACGIAVFFIYILVFLKYPVPGIKPVNIFFNPDDRHMDFFNLVFKARELDVYTIGQGSFNSPLFFLACFIINKIVEGISSGRPPDIYYLLWKTTYCVYITISLAFFILAFHMLFNRFRVKIFERFWFYIVFLLSYPVLFAVDRGNYALMAGGIIALFLVLYLDDRIILSAVILGLAAAFKYYYALFFILFLMDKKWKAFFISAFTAVFIFCCSLALFKGGFINNISVLYNGLLHYNLTGANRITVGEELGHNTSFYMLFDIPYAAANNLFNYSGEMLGRLNNTVSIAAGWLLMLVLILSVLVKKSHDRVLLLASGLLLFPFLSVEYIIPVIFFPMVFWMLNEQEDKVMPWLAGLYIICKRYYSFWDRSDYVSVTIQGIINPLILLAIICYIIRLRRKLLAETLRKIPGILNSAIKRIKFS